MKEQLVTYEIAKLAKNAGFNHMKANCYGDNMAYLLPDGELINSLKGNTVTGYILAPTLSLLQKWLREKHYLHIEINALGQCNYHLLCGKLGKINTIGNNYISYEEALETGIQQLLIQLT